MPYANIPLDFETMNAAYRDHVTLTPEIKAWAAKQKILDAKENERIDVLNEQRRAEGKKDLNHVKSTTCCFQASLGFNATNHSIPLDGTRTKLQGERNNEQLGKNFYIRAVDEFRAFLTYRYGPTDQVNNYSEIESAKGVLIFGNAHIEFWDGSQVLQSTKGLAARRAKGIPVSDAGVIHGNMLASRPMWFWSIGKAAKVSAPEWLSRWWAVNDGNMYYYYFHNDGAVNYIETQPSIKWDPPKTIGNQGKWTINDKGRISIVWSPKPKTAPTIEEFTRGDGGNSEDFMTGTSNNYGPLTARKMATS